MQTDFLATVTSGAKFLRADLHIHSFGGSHDVTDENATPANIVHEAVEQSLSIIALTDHNEIANVPPAISVARGKNILVIPGVELSTPEGHMLCYTETYDALEGFYNSLSIAQRRTSDCRCQTGVVECLNTLRRFGGFAVLAHVDSRGSFEDNVPRLTPAKLDILCHETLLGLEVTRADCPVHYTDLDEDADRRKAAQQRIERCGLGSKQFLARVLNSDAHSLDAVGRNAKQDRRITRYKMESPTFNGLRIALSEPDTRVRIEDEIPASIPRIQGVRFDGGFLDNQCVHFSPNLTCIIGGRGSGKSTTFEALRLIGGYGTPETNSVVDSDIWPDFVSLFYLDETGERHILGKAKGGDLENLDDPNFGSVCFPIEAYRQGETHTISKKAQEDPLALLTFLDRLVRIEQAISEEGELRTKLNELSPEIAKAKKAVDSIPAYKRDLQFKRGQLARLKQDKGEDIIKLQQRLEAERRIRNTIEKTLGELLTTVSQKTATEATQVITHLIEDEKIDQIIAEAANIITATNNYEKSAVGAETALRESTTAYVATVRAQIATWKTKESATFKEIEDKKRDLLAAGIRLDIPFITKLVSDEARLASDLKSLMNWKPHLERLLKDRSNLLRQRWSARSKVAALRSAFGVKATQALANSLSDIFVSLKFDDSNLCPEGYRLLVDAMGWRTLQHLKASALIAELTVPKLLDCVSRNDTSPILSLKSEAGQAIFSQDEAGVLLERISVAELQSSLETVAIYDTPRLCVTKKIVESGRERFVPRDFKRLSLGQQQSVLLALMLTSESRAPLIVDQPEDNLDSEFIYKTLVPVIRMAKERRQVIVVTHNANIAVLGDAEQIVVLKATNDKASIVSRGSIDDAATRDVACAILEGTKEAFERRARIYGIRLISAGSGDAAAASVG